MPNSRSFYFIKMQALANDFMVINNLNHAISLSELPIKMLAHRQLGVGFDQLLSIEPSNHADFSCRIFNSDGNEVEQCGNGLRCVVKYIQDEGLSTKSTLAIETKAGIFTATKTDQIQMSLGIPCFQPEKIPFTMPYNKSYSFQINQQIILASVLSLGNPHFITKVDSLNNYPAKEMGEIISQLPVFPNSTNVGFMEIVNSQHIRLETYERGVGITQACGSNACAAVIAGILNHQLEPKVKVELPHGHLWVNWPNEHGPVFLTGPAEKVFEGKVTY